MISATYVKRLAGMQDFLSAIEPCILIVNVWGNKIFSGNINRIFQNLISFKFYLFSCLIQYGCVNISIN